MLMSDAVSSEGLNTMGIQQKSLALSLYAQRFLNLLMICIVDDEICIAFAIWCWGTLYLKYYTIFYQFEMSLFSG